LGTLFLNKPPHKKHDLLTGSSIVVQREVFYISPLIAVQINPIGNYPYLVCRKLKNTL
jgi:hypothetical protein